MRWRRRSAVNSVSLSLPYSGTPVGTSSSSHRIHLRTGIASKPSHGGSTSTSLNATMDDSSSPSGCCPAREVTSHRSQRRSSGFPAPPARRRRRSLSTATSLLSLTERIGRLILTARHVESRWNPAPNDARSVTCTRASGRRSPVPDTSSGAGGSRSALKTSGWGQAMTWCRTSPRYPAWPPSPSTTRTSPLKKVPGAGLSSSATPCPRWVTGSSPSERSLSLP